MIKRAVIHWFRWMIAYNLVFLAIGILWRAVDMWQFGNPHESISDTIVGCVLAGLLTDKLEEAFKEDGNT